MRPFMGQAPEAALRRDSNNTSELTRAGDAALPVADVETGAVEGERRRNILHHACSTEEENSAMKQREESGNGGRTRPGRHTQACRGDSGLDDLPSGVDHAALGQAIVGDDVCCTSNAKQTVNEGDRNAHIVSHQAT